MTIRVGPFRPTQKLTVESDGWYSQSLLPERSMSPKSQVSMGLEENSGNRHMRTTIRNKTTHLRQSIELVEVYRYIFHSVSSESIIVSHSN